MASDQRSISGSHSVPFSRDSVDAFQDMTAFTPPPDSWLARYPKTVNTQTSKKEDKTSSSSSSSVTTKTTTEKKDISHTKKFKVPEANQLDDTCKRYIETSEIPIKSNKSLGTDDHFKSAVCSKNLLKACEKLMTKRDYLGSASELNDDDFDAELSLMNEQSRMEFYRHKYGNRRDSQSLPASPRMERKTQGAVTHNPYFTVTKQEASRPDTSISFLANLFGLTAVKPKEAQANLAQKYESTNASMFNGGDKQQQQGTKSSRQMTPNPHPYREMNIFSPTSM
ncbi:unnamed protein product [Chironomus riparius]|uniref:Uncharacterized protein n=1 Tax=Chironomus riparius TaxID=315576 RepID=A0A9N9WU98_9DIPT|nr:unnamed protein product [Chironomus riparius]